MVDGRRERGRRTRESILHTAVQLATVEGIDGITIGRLASELGMSKSGLFAHFGSKEELQLATIDAAREIFVETIIAPARQAERGLPRLEALMENWLEYMRREVFKGGCFFDAVRGEYNSRPPGPVRDAVWKDFADWSDDPRQPRQVRPDGRASRPRPPTPSRWPTSSTPSAARPTCASSSTATRPGSTAPVPRSARAWSN